MADSRRYLEQILEEAQLRWLRPSEICEILRNYQKFCLAPDPPYKPPGGSLFLFDRKTLRYFRKDGHCWRKKKDGKTVREAHEKLKAGSVDVLHCYYAHGEDNENFQRRSYWMLDGKLEHIVLVHYREVKEGSRSGVPRLLNADPGAQNQSSSCLTSLAPSSYAQASSPALAGQAYVSSPSTGEWNGQTPSSEFDDVDSGDDIDASPMMEPSSGFRVASLFPSNPANENTLAFNCGSCNPYYPNQVGTLNLTASENLQTEYDASQEAGSLGGDTFGFSASSSNWSEIHSSNRNMSNLHEQKVGSNAMTKGVTDLVSYSVEKESIHTEYEAFPEAHLQILLGNTRRSVHANPKMESVEHVDFLPSDDSLMNESSQIYEIPQEHNFNLMNEPQENYYGSPMNVADNEQSLELSTENCRVEKHALKNLYNEEQQDLKKLDSFGRWMSKEIGRDSLIASESPSYWHSLDTDNNKLSSLSHHMQLDIDSLGPSLSQEQLFSIDDFSPDWAYSDDKTKVLIFGTFLGGLKQRPDSMKWCCMFGEVEVSAEVMTANSLRCQAPAHAPGRVPFYITCSNRLACSEVRDFEYREKPSGSSPSTSVKIEPEEEMRLQIRLAKMLVIGVDKRQWMACSVVNCEKCNLKANISFRNEENEWVNIEKASQENTREALLQKLLKDRLYEWLVCKAHEEGKGPNVLDEEGQGVIHLTSALGYEWAIVPIVAAGVSPSFRDARGRTGLHWAAYYGREETVVALVRLGAAPGAVEDPTSKFPEGRTAADLASSRGHKGIAGYLAEEDLTSHLSYLTLKQSVLDNVPGTFAAAEETVESIEEQNLSPLEGRKEDRSSLRGSLAAVRNSAQAAARIQAAFRVHSFIQRQSTRTNDENSEISSEVIVLASLSNKTQKVGHFSDSLHAAAAIRIQQKYRGWKGRKEFLKIRNRIVKIQAHVRGHQVRKQYKKVVWSVGIVEKAILRWRRKGTGLRGFRVDKAITNVGPEVGKTDEYDFLRMGRRQKKAGVEKALARVQSMVRYPEARDQYMRLVQKSKARDEGSASGDAPTS